ncbi:hypothetical protein BGZ63DRAFT_396192 [Mariannaea sp. PMI_226]|nr:hypothetical protein BGZ63DRAFT_396192 [Mariannaea sp. PMI_226]
MDLLNALCLLALILESCIIGIFSSKSPSLSYFYFIQGCNFTQLPVLIISCVIPLGKLTQCPLPMAGYPSCYKDFNYKAVPAD